MGEPRGQSSISPAASPAHLTQVEDVQLLRATAVLMVLVAHLGFLFHWQPAWFNAFQAKLAYWTGVDLFFAVSGFVIIRQLADGLVGEGGKPRWRHALAFWVRRAFRILPSAWVWIALYVLIAFFLNGTGTFGNPALVVNDALAALFQIANYHAMQAFYYHAQQVGSLQITVYWSLSLEEQFYVLFPFVVFAFNRRLGIVLALLAIVQIAIPRPVHSPLWFFRTDAICLGGLIALAEQRGLLRNITLPALARSSLLRWLVFATLILALGLAGTWSEHWGTGAAAILSACLVWLAACNRNLIAPRGMVRAILLWVGERSYAIYLIHLAAFHMFREIMFSATGRAIFDSSFTAVFAVGALILIAALSELNFRFVETPLRRAGKRIAQRIEAGRQGASAAPRSHTI